MRLLSLQANEMQVLQYGYPRQYCEDLPPREAGTAGTSNTATCERTDDCGWGSVSVPVVLVPVLLVLLVEAFARLKLALTAS